MKTFLPFLLALLLVACETPGNVEGELEVDGDIEAVVVESADEAEDTTDPSEVSEDAENNELEGNDAIDDDVPEAETQSTAVQQFNVTGDEFSYSPSTLTAKAGAPIEIVFSNHGNYRHDLVLEGTDGRTSIIESELSDTFQVTLEPGTYKFYCSVSGHEAQGMKGTLIVQ